MDPAPYGFDAAEGEPGLSIEYSDGAPEETSFSRWSWKRLGFDLPNALRNLRGLRRADVIWTVIEWEWLAASFLQHVGLLQKKPIVGNSVFLGEDYSHFVRVRKHLWPKLMSRNIYLTMHSRRAIDAIARVLPSKAFHFLPFGISTRSFPVIAPAIRERTGQPIHIYSIGDDPRRDWKTMLAAFGGDPRFRIRLACRREPEELNKPYNNTDLFLNPSVEDQRAFFDWADFVVVPMKNNVYSGITVICEAIARGKPVISSRTGGADSYFDDDQVFFVPVGDPEAMRAAALQATPSDILSKVKSAQQRFLDEDYSAAGMVRRYVAISREILGHQRATGPAGRALVG